MKKNKIVILILFLLCLCGCDIGKSKPIINTTTDIKDHRIIDVPNIYNPNVLILVNKDNKVPDEYLKQVQLITTKDIYEEDVQVEKITFDAYVNLKDYLSVEKGINIGIRTAYRSLQDQQDIWDYYINTNGYDYAAKITAPVGYSEHHTGLAIDITPMYTDHWDPIGDEINDAGRMYAVIHSVLHEYGFILRYPKGKESITGYSYESWHIRYVGKDVAKEIYDNNWTLEEYYNDHKETLGKQSN